MTKAVYMYDDNNQFTSTKLVEDDYQISGNETFIAVPDGQYQPSKFTGTEWVGTDKEVYDAEQEKLYQAYLKEHPELAPTVSGEMLAINALGMQVAQIQAKLTTTNGGAS
ncbi:hypothetical protein [Paucilactobacillus nenjiangensis]|uniref:Uncharacterized protein n=1 Tax=Paucilactobacillus nenjiangensis TaxID=1296540 RepID=A0A5P1X5K5_9LACO|nr:hypothetical protein [Paucilactobacillus nenjiangensis]QER67568.1 hypothetical protein F0161_06660 [Paucilactobacillus nenjiangensis]